MDMLIGALAALFGITPAAAVGILVAASIGGSAALRWYRRMRHEENYYLELTRTGGAFGSPQPSPEERRALSAADPSRSGRLRRRLEQLSSS
jgi:hypothetical protein